MTENLAGGFGAPDGKSVDIGLKTEIFGTSPGYLIGGCKKGSIMIDFTTETGKVTSKTTTYGRRSLPGFQYQNGFTFEATDLGNSGVKIEFIHENLKRPSNG